MTQLFDSDNPDAIPDGVWAAGYVSGYAAPAWSLRGWARFPGARRINVFSFIDDGDSFDCESGDITPEAMPGCIQRALRRGVVAPWAYCNRANRQAVEDAMWAAGIAPEQVAMWIATLDGTTAVARYRYPIAAVQYLNAAHSGGHYDISLVNQVYGPAGGELGGFDMATAEEILTAVTVMPPRPASLAAQTDAALITEANTSGVTWDALRAKYGADGEAFIYALLHPESRQTIAQAVQALAAKSGLELGQLQGDVAAIKAEEDQLKSALIQAPSSPVGQDTIQ